LKNKKYDQLFYVMEDQKQMQNTDNEYLESTLLSGFAGKDTLAYWLMEQRPMLNPTSS
jgi:hypothetical protein